MTAADLYALLLALQWLLGRLRFFDGFSPQRGIRSAMRVFYRA